MIPSGIFIKTEDGTFWFKSGKRRRVTTKSVLDSWSPPFVAEIPESEVKQFSIVGKLPFRDGSLLHNVSNGRIYLVSDNKSRRVVGGDTLRLLGLTLQDAIMVSDEEISFMPEGEVIS